MKTFLKAVCLCFVAHAMMWAQISTAEINGTITDATGAVVPGAEVKATNTGTGAVRTITSGADGAYLLGNLPIGPYQIEVTKQGFEKYVASNIELLVNSNPTIPITLKVGAATEEVQVEANATMVETHSTGVGSVMENQSILELPLNGREATSLIFLNGMANVGNGTNLATIRNYPTVVISVAGGLGNGLVYSLDGVTHNDPFNNLNMPLPFPDALQEFKVESSALQAQYGQHSGGAVNMVTKSGTNELHGDLFEFLRNGDLDARQWNAIARDTLKQNQYGGVVGGPIRKDKLFYFAGFQRTDTRSDPAANVSNIPTAAELAGNFQAVASQPCNANQILSPTLGFVNNTISPSTFSPIALKLASLMPNPSTALNACGQYKYGLTNNHDEDLITGKIDYTINSHHSIFGRIMFGRYTTPSTYTKGILLTLGNAETVDQDYSIALGDTYVFGSSVVNAARIVFLRTLVTKVDDNYLPGGFADIGINDVTSFLPNYAAFSITGGFSLGSANVTPSDFNTMEGQVVDDVSWVKGNHQMAFGASYIHPLLNFKSGLNAGGTLSFSGIRTVQGGVSGGVGMADFLEGLPASFAQGNLSIEYNRQHFIGMYAQDSWRMEHGLTVNYGIRWEPYLPIYSKYNFFDDFLPNLFYSNTHSSVYPNMPAGYIFPGDTAYAGMGFSNEHKQMNMWAPRLGLVWDPGKNGKQVFRLSYGIFEDRPHIFYDDGYANDAPFGNSASDTFPTIANPWSTFNAAGTNPFPYVLSPSSFMVLNSGTVSHQLYPKPTYVQNWNFTMERQLSPNWLLVTSYIGDEIVHLWTGNQENPEIYLGTGPCVLANPTAGVGATIAESVCSTTGDATLRRMYTLASPQNGQYMGAMAMQDTGGTGSYEALYASVRHRLSKGFSVSSNFTWSHCIDNVANSELGTAGPTYEVPYNRAVDRSNCTQNDQRLAFNVTAVAAMPHFSNKMLDRIASNWQISTATSVRSGVEFSVASGVDNAYSGQGNHPNVVGGVSPYVSKNNNCPLAPCINDLNAVGTGALDTTAYNAGGGLAPVAGSAFQEPLNGTYGTACCSNYDGPKQIEIDTSLVRTFVVRERKTLQFRLEEFNLPNYVNFSTPSATVTAVNFGQITTASAPGRILQAALKFVF